MRVTAAQVYRSQLRHMRRKSQESSRAQNVAASGLRLHLPSDDAVGAARSVRIRGMRGDVETARGKIDTVNRELTHQESALGQMGDVLSRARALTVQMASAVPTAANRQAAANAVDGLRDELIAMGNARIGERRLFSGSQIGTDAFDAAGTYQGDNVGVSVGIYDNATVQVTLDGSAVLGGTGGGPDILTSLADLSTALQANNVAGVQAELTNLVQGQEWISQQRSLIGARMNLTDGLDGYLADLEVQLVDDQSQVEDADVVEAYSNLVRTQTAFESVLQVTAASRTPDVFQLLGV